MILLFSSRVVLFRFRFFFCLATPAAAGLATVDFESPAFVLNELKILEYPINEINESTSRQVYLVSALVYQMLIQSYQHQHLQLVV